MVFFPQYNTRDILLYIYTYIYFFCVIEAMVGVGGLIKYLGCGHGQGR